MYSLSNLTNKMPQAKVKMGPLLGLGLEDLSPELLKAPTGVASAFMSPMADAATAGAAGAAGGGGLLAKLLGSGGNPLGVAASIGIPFLLDLVSSHKQQQQREELMQDQKNMINALKPQLKAQAEGQETAATRAIMKQVEKQANRSRQAAAASATRSGQMGTAVGRAQQERIGYERDANLTQLLGQQQQQGIQQYQNLINQIGALGGARSMLAQEEQQSRLATSAALSKLFTKPDSQLTEMGKKNKDMLDKMAENMPNFDKILEMFESYISTNK